MSDRPRPSNWPFALLGVMSVVCFVGPLVIFFVVRGGPSPVWPPDRAIEWITIITVIGLFIVLFFACITIGWWYTPLRRGKAPPRGQ
jgi:hypothetical protein